MHTHSIMRINLLGTPRPRAHRSAVKVFPSSDEIFPIVLIGIGILLGLIAICARICGV
jgi:hypothetical protein